MSICTRPAVLLASASVALATLAPLQFGLGLRRESDVPQRLRAGLLNLPVDESVALSDVDRMVGGDHLWTFPALLAAQLQVGDTLLFALPGGFAVEMPLVSRGFAASDALGFNFADLDAGNTAEILVRDGLVTGTVRAVRNGVAESWRLDTDPAIGAERWTPREPEHGGFTAISPSDVPDLMKRIAGSENGVEGGIAGGDGGVADACADNGALIDLLIAYTPAFLAGFESETAMKTAILADVARTNAALANSRVWSQFRVKSCLVGGTGFHPLATDGSGNLADDLLALVDLADGEWDEISRVRNNNCADLVVLCSTSNDPAITAVGFIGVGNAALGFCAISQTEGLDLATALGFNMGCCTDNPDPDAPEQCDGFFEYSHGYRFEAGTPAAKYRTIMTNPIAGEDEERIPHYSNPIVAFAGEPTGVAGPNNTNLVSNAQTIALTSSLVARYRCSIGPITDCNNNGIDDAIDISSGTELDCNFTGIPDSCDIALGISLDIDNDGIPDECPVGDIEFATGGISTLDTLGTAVGASTRAGDPAALFAIGAPLFDNEDQPTTISNSGGVYALDIQAGAIVGQTLLQPTVPVANAYFGRGLAAFKRPVIGTGVGLINQARDFVLAGAYRESIPSDTSKGSMYLFARTPGGAWTQLWKISPTNLVNPDPSGVGFDYALFGSAVAMGRSPRESADQIIVGAPGESGGRGRIYIYRNYVVGTSERGGYQSFRSLTQPAVGDNFGTSVAIEGFLPLTTSATASRVIAMAGAPGRNNGKGSVYIYDRAPFVTTTGGLGTFPTTPIILTPTASGSQLVEGDRFGTAVAIKSNLLAIGAPGTNGGRGRVHFWERRVDVSAATPSSYSYRGFFDPPTSIDVKGFGSSISIAPSVVGGGFTIVVGAPKSDVVSPSATRVKAGRVLVLTRQPGTSGAVLDSVRIENNAASGNEFGYSASSTPGFSLIGIPFNDERGLNAGKARAIPTP
ncbi:MAG: hypothetical protein QM516_00420 [Limnohabitans sp.]|nr:hypothetical protein [Limnohabitans sp.]